VAADVIARYWRLRGLDVLFATGTDEHGQKVLTSAQAQGKNAQEFVDGIAAAYKAAWSAFHVSNDVFIRTTDPQHMAVVQGVFDQLRSTGDIYLGTYEGWYCVPCESYFREDELVEGNCPDCSRPTSSRRASTPRPSSSISASTPNSFSPIRDAMRSSRSSRAGCWTRA
jgi:methionyl-tRNA synthetase